MAAIKPKRNDSVRDTSDCPSEMRPQKTNEDSLEPITTDNTLSSEIPNNSTFEDPLKKHSYNIHESESETGWPSVHDRIAKDDNKNNKNSYKEKSRETDLAITDWKKVEDIPLKFDEIPPEPSWTTVSYVVVKDPQDNSISEGTETDLSITDWEKVEDIPLKFDELPPEPGWATVSKVVVKNKKDNSTSSKKYDHGKKELPQRHVNRRSSCPENHYSSYNIHKKQINPVLDVMMEYDNKNSENSGKEESLETDLAITDWKKVNSIPLKFDELPPEPGWATVSTVVVKNEKDNSKSKKKYDYGEKGLQQTLVNRSSCPENQYSEEALRAKLLQKTRDEMKDDSLNRSHKLEDFEQKNNSYRDNRDSKYMQHDQYYHYRRSSKHFTSHQMSSVPYRPRDPSPDYD